MLRRGETQNPDSGLRTRVNASPRDRVPTEDEESLQFVLHLSRHTCATSDQTTIAAAEDSATSFAKRDPELKMVFLNLQRRKYCQCTRSMNLKMNWVC
uniref:Uncharacterized protein n=1 Tax=Sphaerodactylus townsendi TaxID=933632 RepID=A0ACB8E5X1_9SAUR